MCTVAAIIGFTLISLTQQHHAGRAAASVSRYFIGASILLLVLLLSKMSANLKSLVKDDHWMQRVELVLDRLGRAGIQGQESIVDIMQAGSMSNYAWPQHGHTAQGNQTFGIAGGYGARGIGAKAAIAPPSSGADNAHDCIAAGNITADNTVDGYAVRPAEAHL